MHKIEDFNAYRAAIQLYNGLLDESDIERAGEIKNIGFYLENFLNKFYHGEMVPPSLLRSYFNQLTEGYFNKVHGSASRFFWCVHCNNFDGAKVNGKSRWYDNAKHWPLKFDHVTQVRCKNSENSFSGEWWYDDVKKCSGWSGSFSSLFHQARADIDFLLNWFLENMIPLIIRNKHKLNIADVPVVTLQDLELVRRPTPDACFRLAILHLMETRMTVDEYENAISSGLPRRDWPGDDFEIERLSPGHPLGDSRRKRQKAAQFFMYQAHGSPSAISSEILSQLHISIFDCDPAVRQDVVRTLTILRSPETIPSLLKLASMEKESSLVRLEVENAIAAMT